MSPEVWVCRAPSEPCHLIILSRRSLVGTCEDVAPSAGRAVGKPGIKAGEAGVLAIEKNRQSAKRLATSPRK